MVWIFRAEEERMMEGGAFRFMEPEGEDGRMRGDTMSECGFSGWGNC